jgi:hypothetical protein
MNRQVLAAVIVFAPLSTTANSVECKAELPAARTGHWSWRNIDGKRCWYPGRAGMDKAGLQWPRSAPKPARHDGDSSQPKQDLVRPKQDFVQPIQPKLERELPFIERWPR